MLQVAPASSPEQAFVALGRSSWAGAHARYSVVRNAFLDAAKGRMGRIRSLEDPLGPEHGSRAGGSRPDDALEGAEERRRLWAAVRRVPAEFRSALVLFDIEGCTYDEAADYSLQQHALWGALELSLGRRARLGAFASGQLAFTGLGSFRGLWALVRLSRRLELVLRYDLVVNDSNVARPPEEGGRCDITAPDCHVLDYDDKNYVKHVVGLEGVWRW